MEGDGIKLKIHKTIKKKNGKEYELYYINVPSKVAKLLNLEQKEAILDPKTNCIFLKEKTQSS
jgi:hypothetical protein